MYFHLRNWNFCTICRHYHNIKHFYNHLLEKVFLWLYHLSAYLDLLKLLKTEKMQYLYQGQGFREAFAWQMIRWNYNVRLQHTCPSVMLRCFWEVWRTRADRLTDLQQPQICEDLVSKDSPVSAHEHWGGKLTLWQPVISISARHVSAYTSLWCQEGQHGRNPSFSLNSRTESGSVGSEIQINGCISEAEGW